MSAAPRRAPPPLPPPRAPLTPSPPPVKIFSFDLDENADEFSIEPLEENGFVGKEGEEGAEASTAAQLSLELDFGAFLGEYASLRLPPIAAFIHMRLLLTLCAYYFRFGNALLLVLWSKGSSSLSSIASPRRVDFIGIDLP